MAQSPEQMAASMLANVPDKTGRSLEEWHTILGEANLTKHGEMVKLLKGKHGIGHGFANLITHEYRSGGEKESDPIAMQYSGKKEHLRPIYDAIVTELSKLGGDVEISPKKTYVSLRRNKQFATVGPATNTSVDVGLNLKGVPATARLKAVKAAMVSHTVRLSEVAKVDKKLIAWLKQAYDAS